MYLQLFFERLIYNLAVMLYMQASNEFRNLRVR